MRIFYGVFLASLSLGAFVTTTARADDAITTAPAAATAAVTGPKAPGAAPSFGPSTDVTNVTLSAGGNWVTGNSQLLAGSVNGAFEKDFGKNVIAASVIGNYGQGAPVGSAVVQNTENIQGRIRYDRYLYENFAAFLMVTGRQDRFQGLDFRLNIDPGFKYLIYGTKATAFWGELGYDFQYDIRRTDALVQLDSTGTPATDANGNTFPCAPGIPCLARTEADSAARLFLGFRHSFNSDVTAQTGLEYLQSVQDSTKYRINYDLLVAAKLYGGVAFGLGFSARYDHDPLPGKKELDTATTVSLIYSFSNAAPPPPANCPPPPPPGGTPNPPMDSPADNANGSQK